MEKPDNCDHLAVWQEISPFLCNVNMGQFSFVPILISFAPLHARLKCLGLQRWMEEELRKLRRLWPQYGPIVWRRCNRFESFIPSSFFIAKENHDYLKHVLLVIYCVRIKLQGIPQVTFAQSHPMPRWVLLLLLLLLLSLVDGFYPSLWIVHWPPLTFVQSHPMSRWAVCLLQSISAIF